MDPGEKKGQTIRNTIQRVWYGSIDLDPLSTQHLRVKQYRPISNLSNREILYKQLLFNKGGTVWQR